VRLGEDGGNRERKHTMVLRKKLVEGGKSVVVGEGGELSRLSGSEEGGESIVGRKRGTYKGCGGGGNLKARQGDGLKPKKGRHRGKEEGGIPAVSSK